MYMPEIITEGDKIFKEVMDDGKTFLEAAHKAYPEKNSPIDYALSKPENKKYMREGFHDALYTAGFTISHIAEQKMEALKMAYEDPKGSKAADTIIQDIQKLYDLYPEVKSGSLTVNNNIDLSSKVEVQQAVLNSLYTDAAKHSSPEQIDQMVEGDIIEDMGVLPPEDLFEVTDVKMVDEDEE